MNQRVRKHHYLDDVPAAGATNTDAPAVGEFCDLLIVERKLVDAVGGSRTMRHLFLIRDKMPTETPLARRTGISF